MQNTGGIVTCTSINSRKVGGEFDGLAQTAQLLWYYILFERWLFIIFSIRLYVRDIYIYIYIVNASFCYTDLVLIFSLHTYKQNTHNPFYT